MESSSSEDNTSNQAQDPRLSRMVSLQHIENRHSVNHQPEEEPRGVSRRWSFPFCLRCRQRNSQSEYPNCASCFKARKDDRPPCPPRKKKRAKTSSHQNGMK